MRLVNASDGNFEDGSLRADVNVSVDVGDAFGTLVEEQNLNSFSQIAKAVHFEVARQQGLRENGEEVQRETRTWDEKEQRTLRLRQKGGAVDYRYIPEPDLPPIVLTQRMLERDSAEEAPADVRSRWRQAHGFRSTGGLLPDESVYAILAAPRALSAHVLFDLLAAEPGAMCAKSAAHWIEHKIIKPLREQWESGHDPMGCG